MSLRIRGPRCRAASGARFEQLLRGLVYTDWPCVLPRPWYVKGVFETDDSLDPRHATTGYVVLVSSALRLLRAWSLVAQLLQGARVLAAADKLDEGLVAAAHHSRAR